MNSKAQEDWYVYSEGEQYGPYSLEDIRQYLAEGRIDENSLGWNSTLPDWQSLKQVITDIAKENKAAESNSRKQAVSKKPSTKEDPVKIGKQFSGHIKKAASAKLKGKMSGFEVPLKSAARWNVIVGEDLPQNPLTSIFGQGVMPQGEILAEKSKSTINSWTKNPHRKDGSVGSAD